MGVGSLGRFDADELSVPLNDIRLEGVQKDVSQLGTVDLGSFSRLVRLDLVAVVLVPQDSAITFHQLHRLRTGKGVLLEILEQTGFT